MLTHWIISKAALDLVLIVAIGPPGDSAAKGGDLEIALKRTEPARLVYLEHSGPYWSMGPLFTPVQEQMTARREKGPIVVRYSADPTAVSPKSLRTQVGFLASGDWEVEPPFKSEALDSVEVASAIVPGPSGTTTRHYSAIREWITQQGRKPLGPVMELYPASRSLKASDLRIEIQMALAEPETPAVAPPSRIGPAVPRQPIAAAPVAAQEPTATAPAEPILAVKDLVEAGRYERVAEQLMPADRPMPATTQLWLGQLVFRIGAVAKGLQERHADRAAPVKAVADALMARYRLVSAGSAADPLAQAVVRVDSAGDPMATKKRAITRDLDRLLGRVATKAADPDAALTELTRITQEIQDLSTPPAP